MAELDKFKRRVIRSVARKLIHEKKSSEELWKELKTETKCECKILWERMRALTLKKLKRLLLAEDKVENIIPVAQMSLTDWLLFDLVLVHEDIDVIGRDLRGNESEIRPLEELLDLISDFDIENKQGEALVAAWTQVTYTYNNRGRQCSPMILQKRWYQMKKQIRTDFYQFWNNYRGNFKLLEKVTNIPSKFEMKVATRYPDIVVKQFLEWDKLIEQKYVILPEEFENKFRSQSLTKSVSTNENEPDVVLLEPNIVTIELADVESDSENVSENNERPTSPDHSIPSENIVIKTERAENTDLEIQANSEQLAKELRERDTKLLQSIPDIDGDDDDTELDEAVAENDVEEDAENSVTNLNEECIGYNDCEDSVANLNEEYVGPNECEDSVANINEELVDPNECEDSVANNTSSMTSENIPETIVMPQITNVFGNVNVESEVLAKFSSVISKNIEETCKVVPDTAIRDDQMNVDDNEVNEKLKSFLDNQNKADADLNKSNATDQRDEKKESQIKQTSSDVENARVTNPFMGIPIDLTFSDDGIELVDDGIEYDDEEDIIKTFMPEDIKSRDTSASLESTPIKHEELKCVEEGPKFDLKLLMNLMVYTTKLDDMIVLKNSTIDSISDKQLIENIISESKPVRKINKSVEPKQENQEHADNDLNPVENDEYSDTDDEKTIETEAISEDKRVKPTSFLLQKPRSRSYNPIQLCRNPDFNTRLKRLTVGFLSSTRNRAMLKSLKPMTVDISKAFECKLIEGTLYLKSSDTTAPVEKVVEANEQMTAIVPSAVPVQSLIDQITPQHMLSVLNPDNDSPNTKQSALLERNKIITLPDIDNIRKMNRRLYTAEITPMRVLGHSEIFKPPVQLVNNQTTPTADKYNVAQLNQQMNLKHHNTNYFKQKCDPKLSKRSNFTTQLKHYKKKVEWSTASWLCKSANVHKDYGDALITIDTLSKMFKVINGSPEAFTDITKLSKSDRKALMKKEKKANKALISKICNNEPRTADNTTQIQENEQLELTKKSIFKKRQQEELKKRDEETKLKEQEALVLKKKRAQALMKKEKKANKTLISKISNNESRTADNNTTQIQENDQLELKKKCEFEKRLQEELKKREEETKLKEQEALVLRKKRALESKMRPKSVRTKVCINAQLYKSEIYCCWARLKLLMPNVKRKHMCPILCNCCCRNTLAENMLEAKNPHLITISDDEELQSNKVTDSNKIAETTRQSSPIKLIHETIPVLDQTPVPSAGTQTKVDKNTKNINESDVIEIDDSEIAHTSSNHSLDDQPKSDDLETLLPNCKIPRIKVLPASALVAPTIRPIGHGNQYITLIPRKLKEPIENLVGNPSRMAHHRKHTDTFNQMKSNHNRDTGKSAKNILYLNRNHGDTGKESPIYLGRNRILLTDGIMPDDLSTESTSQEVINMDQTETNVPNLVLPEGVQILLLPDGNLSCTVDPTAKLDAEKIATLPHILSAVQHQLSELKGPSASVDLTKHTSEVVNLTDDEISDNNANNLANRSKPTAENIDSIDTVSSIGKAITSTPIDIENEILQNIVANASYTNKHIAEPNIPTTSQPICESNQDTEINIVRDVQNGTTKSHEDSSVISSYTAENAPVLDSLGNQNNTENKDSDEIMQSITECASISVDLPGKNCSDNKNSVDDQTCSNLNRNTLLSDLMQMSGISMEDVAPATTDNSPEVPPLSFLPKSIAQSAKLSSPLTKQLSELTSISTFSQLQYACKKNRNFFTLDLETGAVSTIAVRIKKNVSKNIDSCEKIVIDLTSDQDNCDDLTVSQNSRSLLKPSLIPPVQPAQPTQAQPLKLFRSIGILNRKRMSKENLNASQQKHRERQRKQLLDACGNQDNINLSQVCSGSESSDDEPLATKAKRMRCVEDQTQPQVENIIPNQLRSADSDESENKEKTNNKDINKSLPQANTDLSQQNIDFPEENMDLSQENNDLCQENKEQENKEQDDMEAEISFLCYDDESDDNNDCILGV